LPPVPGIGALVELQPIGKPASTIRPQSCVFAFMFFFTSVERQIVAARTGQGRPVEAVRWPRQAAHPFCTSPARRSSKNVDVVWAKPALPNQL
jgi:hypothetical protein